MINLSSIITDVESLRSRILFRDGFAFTSLANIGNTANIFDAIIIRNPINAQCFTPRLGKSMRSLSEHISFINEHKLEKAVIIAENIDFLKECPTLTCLQIVPADSAVNFDYSPLYCLKQIKSLCCSTEYGINSSKATSIEYKHFDRLCDLDIAGTGHLEYNQLLTLKRLNISRTTINDITNAVCFKELVVLNLTQCNIKTLCGISQACALQELSLWHNRGLCDVTDISGCAASLKKLTIGSCNKIIDFSFLYHLHNLEQLQLIGNNSLDNLDFLLSMKNIKCFVFSMNVASGDLSPCLSVPYVYSQRDRKHYNIKDKDLPKMRF